jgi:hypothetical protein
LIFLYTNKYFIQFLSQFTTAILIIVNFKE